MPFLPPPPPLFLGGERKQRGGVCRQAGFEKTSFAQFLDQCKAKTDNPAILDEIGLLQDLRPTSLHGAVACVLNDKKPNPSP